MSKEFQRTYSVLFLRYIELRTKTVIVTRLSSKTIVVLRDREESKVESGKPAKTRASQGTNPIGISEKG